MSVSVAASALLAAQMPLAATLGADVPPVPVVEPSVGDPAWDRMVFAPAPDPTAPTVAATTPADWTFAPAPSPTLSGDEVVAEPVADGVVITGRGADAADPLAAVNEESFKATQAVDQAAVRPAAMAYKSALPRPARDGLRNFFANLREPVVAINYLLQLKPGKAAETVGRFVINSTAGVAGLFDVAKKEPFRLPRRPNGLANTLGYYGVKTGAYFYLPLVGPTTVRDAAGDLIDGLFLPVAVGKPFTSLTYTLPANIVRSLDRRVETDAAVARLNASPDPYRATRDLYLLEREQEIERLHTGEDPAPAAVEVPAEGAPGE